MWAGKLGGVESQGIPSTGQTVSAGRGACCALWLCWEGLFRRGAMASASSSVLEKAIPQLILVPNALVPSHVPLVSFKLLLQCWSSATVSVSTCVGPLRGTPGNPAVSSTDSISTGFYSQKPWGLIILIQELWVGDLV